MENKIEKILAGMSDLELRELTIPGLHVTPTLGVFVVTNDGTKTTIATLAGDYFRFGDASTTSHSLNANDDVLFTGKTEHDGKAFFDGTTEGIIASEVEVSELSTATYDDVQDYINFFGDRTLLSGGTISDNGDGTAAVASLTGWCKVSDSPTAVGRFFNFAGGNTSALVDLMTNYVFLDYNGGTPQLVVTTTFLSLALKLDHIEIGTIYRQGTTLHFHQHHNIGIDRANVIDIHHQEENPPHRASGLVTSDNGSLTLDITAGVIYEGIDREDTSPFNTPNSGAADATEANKLHDDDGGFAITDVGKTVHNTTDDTYANVIAFVDSGELTLDADIFISGENYDLDMWTACYTPDNGSTWTLVKGQTTIDNNNYNNVASGLVALTANRYAVHWVFIDLDGNHLNVVYGQGDYTASQAIDAGVPALMPDLVVHYSAFIAKIIVRKGQTDLVIAYPWTSAFSTSLATDHGNLAGLSDDDHPQYVLVTDLEDTPTEDEANKATTSEYIFDHNANATAHHTKYTNAEAVSAAEAAGLTFVENKGIILDAALSADEKWSGISEAGVAGATLDFGDCIYQVASDAQWELAKADVAATSDGKLGINVSIAQKSAGNAMEVLLYGKVRSDADYAFSVRRPVYISAATAGDLTTTAPTGTEDFVVRKVGYGNTADELFFCPDNSYIELAAP